MATAAQIRMVRGLPYTRNVRVTNVKAVWSDLSEFEVRSHLRVEQDPESELILDLTQYLTPEFDGDDLIIKWRMTGAQTRLVILDGSFDIVLSDVGPEDAKAYSVIAGTIRATDLTTTAEGA